MQNVFHGLSLQKGGSVFYPDGARVAMRSPEDGRWFGLNDTQLSRHGLILGAPGFGKTCFLLNAAEQLRETAAPADTFVFFDTKGDYLERLYRENDAVIGLNGAPGSVCWNVFEDMLADGSDPESLMENAVEIASLLFAERIERAKDPFFPNEARDLVAGLLYSLTRQGAEDRRFAAENNHNLGLRQFVERDLSMARILRELAEYPETGSVRHVLCAGGEMDTQSHGVLSEAAGMLRECFTGDFAGKGDFSVRRFVRKEQGAGRALFIEYDARRGNTLAPVYRALLDLILQESVSRRNRERRGRLFLFCDEISLVPRLKHLSTAVNFGRGLNVSVFIGAQSVGQLTHAYGETMGSAVLSNFGTCIAFNSGEQSSRDVVAQRCGKSVWQEQVVSATGQVSYAERQGAVIEDYRITTLGVGQAVVHTLGEAPYVFRFSES